MPRELGQLCEVNTGSAPAKAAQAPPARLTRVRALRGSKRHRIVLCTRLARNTCTVNTDAPRALRCFVEVNTVRIRGSETGWATRPSGIRIPARLRAA
eukprot:2467064-Prymnesium_polylepis.1